MDILPLHIEYLLTRHDCVIVPGLGAFIATETEAYIDPEAGVICPRRREISFNRSVVTDDGLLSHSIARREGISYEEARRLVSICTERLLADLDTEGEISLGMTGRLLKDDEGLISFRPRQSATMTDLAQAIRIAAIQATMQETDGNTAAPTTEEDAKESDGMRTIRVPADRYVFTVSKRAVHAAAMLITILTVGVSLLLPMNHDNEQKASVISIDELFLRKAAAPAQEEEDNIGSQEVASDSISVIEVQNSPEPTE